MAVGNFEARPLDGRARRPDSTAKNLDWRPGIADQSLNRQGLGRDRFAGDEMTTDEIKRHGLIGSAAADEAVTATFGQFFNGIPELRPDPVAGPSFLPLGAAAGGRAALAAATDDLPPPPGVISFKLI